MGLDARHAIDFVVCNHELIRSVHCVATSSLIIFEALTSITLCWDSQLPW
jgi:hypothetical protein